jgi:hypothetical protein
MATIDDSELDKIKQAIDAAEKGFKLNDKQLGSLKKAADGFEASITRTKTRMTNFAEALENDNKTLKSHIQNTKALNKTIEEEIKYAKEHSKTIDEFDEKVKELKSSFKDLSYASRKEIESKIDSTRRWVATTSAFTSLIDSAKPTFAQLSKAGSTVLSNYQSGGSQISGAAAVLEGAVGAAGSAAQAAGKGISTVGSALMAIPGPAMAVGAVLSVVGAGLGLAGQAAQELASKVLPFLARELENNIKAFQSLNSTGAIFAGGLTDMIKTSGDAGLTLTQFDSVVKNNRESLAGLGESVATSTKRLSSVFKTGGDSFKQELLSMGYTVEEQGGLIAETMRSMRQSGSLMTATNPEILAQTKKYADNLRIVSDITGEDAKKKMEEIKKQNQRLAIQQELSNLTADQRAAFERAQMNMSGLQRDALSQMIALKGAIADPELAAAVAQSPALKESLNLMYQKFQEGTLDDTVTRDIQSQYGDQVKEQLKTLTGIAQAGMAGVGGIAGAIEKRLGEELEFRNRFTPQAIKQAADDLERAKNEAQQRDSQTRAMTDVIMNQQKLNVEIQQKILESDVMGTYARAVSSATEALLDMVAKFTGTNRNAPRPAAVDTPASRGEATTPANMSRTLQGPAGEAAQFGPVPTVQQLTAEQKQEWLKLPADIKKKFQNNPVEWLKSKNQAVPAQPVTPPAPTAPPPPVQPTAPPAAEPPKPQALNVPKTIDPLDPNGGNYIPGPKKFNVGTRQWEPVTLAAQPGYNPPKIMEPTGTKTNAIPVEKTQPATGLPTPDQTAEKLTPEGKSAKDEKSDITVAIAEYLKKEEANRKVGDPVLNENLAKNSAYLEEMVDLLKDVASHTKNTAMAVG